MIPNAELLLTLQEFGILVPSTPEIALVNEIISLRHEVLELKKSLLQAKD